MDKYYNNRMENSMQSKKEREQHHMLVAVIDEQMRSLQAALDRALNADPTRPDYIIGGLEGAMQSAIKSLNAAIETITQPEEI